jgi:hypothetical protein
MSSVMEARSDHSTATGICLVRAERTRDLVCRLVLLLVCLVLWIPRLSGPINFRWDASTYYVLGTALAEGKGYRLLNEPGEIQAVQYPPLLPVTVAALQRILGTHDYYQVGCALRVTYLILSVLFLLLSYELARKLLSPLWALLVGVVTALSFSSFIGPSDALYAEIPFAVAAMAFLLCQLRPDDGLSRVASGIFAAVAYLFRTAGLVLLLAWVGESLIQRRFRQAVVRAAVSAIPVLLWHGYVWQVTHSREYRHPTYSYQRAPYYYSNVTYRENSRLVDPFRPELGQVGIRDLTGRLARNIAALPLGLGESTVSPGWFVPSLVRQLKSARVPLSDTWPKLFSVVFYTGLFVAGLLAVVGAALAANGSKWFLSAYFALTLSLIVVTPWHNQFWRYLAPMAPVTLTFMFLTLFAFRDQLKRRHGRWGERGGALVTAAPVTAILLTQVAVAAHIFRSMGPVSYYDATGRERVSKMIDYGNEWHSLDPAFEWIRRNAPDGAVIAATVPHLAYLRTGHKAVLPPLEQNTDAARRLLDEVPVSFIVLDSFGEPGISERYAAPLVAEKPQDWRLVFTGPDSMTHVYQRNR